MSVSSASQAPNTTAAEEGKYPCQHASQAPLPQNKRQRMRERKRERKKGVDRSQALQWPSEALGLDAFLRLSLMLKDSSCSDSPAAGREALLSTNMFGMS